MLWMVELVVGCELWFGLLYGMPRGRTDAGPLWVPFAGRGVTFIDRRIRAADNPVIPGPPLAQPEQGEEEEEGRRSRTLPFQSEPINLAEEASTSSSSGYTASPSPQRMNQPIDLSNLLTIPGAGRGRGRGAGRGHSPSPRPSHGRRGTNQPGHPPRFSPAEIEASHRDKRQRLDGSSNEGLPPQISTVSTPVWAPQFIQNNKPITIRDSVESEGTAMALSTAFRLPKDMQKEAMQKMVAMSQKLGQSEPQRAKLVGENAQLQNTIICLERERNQARSTVNELKSKLEGAEDSLGQTLTELELSKNEAKESYQQGYNQGINVATESYTNQMPGIQDQVFPAGWTACLKKSGAEEFRPSGQR